MTTPFVEVAELQELLASPEPPVLLDVRWSLTGPPGAELVEAGHVPGAVFVDLDRTLAGPRTPTSGRHPLPEPAAFAAAMRRAGVTLDRPVVAMDGSDGSVAARAWWLLRHHGHDHVRVLSGGWAAWCEAGGAVETGPAPEPYDDAGPATAHPFTAAVARMPVVDADGAAVLARDGLLLDARAAARYAGEVEPVDPVAGHVPGAVSAPTTGSVDEHGRFLPLPVLRERFEALGVAPGVAVGASCGSGVTATHVVLVLHALGVEAALYAGSWSEWVTDPSRPVARGSEPG